VFVSWRIDEEFDEEERDLAIVSLKLGAGGRRSSFYAYIYTTTRLHN